VLWLLELLWGLLAAVLTRVRLYLVVSVLIALNGGSRLLLLLLLLVV